jgi:hypothetical protein
MREDNAKNYRFIYWITGKHSNVRILLAFLILAAAILSISVGGRYVYLSIAKQTFLKSYYDKVELAKKQDRTLPIGNYLGQNVSSMNGDFWDNQFSRRPGVGDCFRVHYTDGEYAGQHGYRCYRYFNTYYGVREGEELTVNKAHSSLISRGWRLTDEQGNNVEEQQANLLSGDGFDLEYINSQDQKASLVTYRLPQPRQCNGDAVCEFAQGNTAKDYKNLLVFRITVSQEK